MGWDLRRSLVLDYGWNEEDLAAKMRDEETSMDQAPKGETVHIEPRPAAHKRHLLSMLFESKFALLVWGTVAGSILVPYIQRYAEQRQSRLATTQAVLSELSAYTNLSWEEYQLVLPYNLDRAISREEYREAWKKIMDVKLHRYNSLGSLKSKLVLLGTAKETDPIKQDLDEYARTLNPISDHIVAALGYFFCRSNPCADDSATWDRDDDPDFAGIELSINNLDSRESQIYTKIQELITR
jgi:hypothetical protein